MATVESKWEEIKELVASLETDVSKNANGNAADKRQTTMATIEPMMATDNENLQCS